MLKIYMLILILMMGFSVYVFILKYDKYKDSTTNKHLIEKVTHISDAVDAMDIERINSIEYIIQKGSNQYSLLLKIQQNTNDKLSLIDNKQKVVPVLNQLNLIRKSIEYDKRTRNLYWDWNGAEFISHRNFRRNCRWNYCTWIYCYES